MGGLHEEEEEQVDGGSGGAGGGGGGGGGLGVDADCSVGTIVWVRRRNGSWWPGKILSASYLTKSPRSAGTPVKLLGRDDASVDWYNLEKSKRVKAFRCGEFDDCIDKAEKSQGTSIRKREKYARREDAILHALELEREHVEKKLVKVNSAGGKKAITLKKELGASSGRLGNDNCKSVNDRSQSLAKGPDFSLKEESAVSPLYGQRGKSGKQSSMEEDKSEAVPRMRGLQDFGLRIAPKKKSLASVVSDGSRRPSTVDNHVHALRSGSWSLGSASPVTSGKSLLAVKRKRTQDGPSEESLVRRRDRRRPLAKVLQSSAKLLAKDTLQSEGDDSPSMDGENEQAGVVCRAKRSRCVYLPADSNDILSHAECPSGKMQLSPSQVIRNSFHVNPGSLTEETTSTSGLMEETESDSSGSDPDMDEEQTVLSDSTKTKVMAGLSNGCIQRQTGSLSSEELDEAMTVDYMSRHDSHNHAATAATDLGMSKWKLKGKRNIRNLMNRPTGKGGRKSSGSIHEAYLEGKGNWGRALGDQRGYHGGDSVGYDFDEDGVIEKNSNQNQLPAFVNGRYPSKLKEVSKDCDRFNSNIVGLEKDLVWETDGLCQADFRGYWDETGECYNPLYTGSRLINGKGSMFIDVDLKVQASYQGEHVPLVSLMSGLNGKAIIGHPIQIEVLEDGASDIFLSTIDLSEEPTDHDRSTEVGPVWRTARRTAKYRIPHPHPSTTLNGDDAGDASQNTDLEIRPSYNKLRSLCSDQITRMSSDVCCLTEKKCPRKPIRKVNVSSKKTRTLSSIAVEQKLKWKGGNRKVGKHSGLDGLIKSVNGPTTVTCIPVKLVFSRLLEAVGRAPSRPTNPPIVSVNGNTERKQVKDPI